MGQVEGALLPFPTPEYAVLPSAQTYGGGFGRDLPDELGVAWMKALAIQPRRHWMERLLDRSFGHDSVQADWDLATRHSYGYGPIPLPEVRFSDVSRFYRYLRSQWSYPELKLSDIRVHPDRPLDVWIPPMHPEQTWRHAGFARSVVGDRLVHLQTREMQNPAAVWNYLTAHFRRYCTFLLKREFDLLPGLVQAREMVSFHLATYEQLLGLVHDQKRELALYRESISQRMANHPFDALILGLEDGDVHDVALAPAQHQRVRAYDQLLRWLINQCVDELEQSVDLLVRP